MRDTKWFFFSFFYMSSIVVTYCVVVVFNKTFKLTIIDQILGDLIFEQQLGELTPLKLVAGPGAGAGDDRKDEQLEVLRHLGQHFNDGVHNRRRLDGTGWEVFFLAGHCVPSTDGRQGKNGNKN